MGLQQLPLRMMYTLPEVAWGSYSTATTPATLYRTESTWYALHIRPFTVHPSHPIHLQTLRFALIIHHNCRHARQRTRVYTEDGVLDTERCTRCTLTFEPTATRPYAPLDVRQYADTLDQVA